MITPMLYHSTLCSRLTYTALASMTSHLGLHVPIPRHWYDFQTGSGHPRLGWIVAVKAQWEENKTNLWQEIKVGFEVERDEGHEEDPGLVVYLDAQWDSSRNGFHGTISVINVADYRVIDMVTTSK
ncbi:unnamed protein product [Calypogeia fissa]